MAGQPGGTQDDFSVNVHVCVSGGPLCGIYKRLTQTLLRSG